MWVAEEVYKKGRMGEELSWGIVEEGYICKLGGCEGGVEAEEAGG